jgi:glutamate 5-kinase
MSISNNKRVVLKVGSALIAPQNNGCSSHNLLAIAQFIIKCRSQGKQIVLVSSGSVAAGRKWFDAPVMTVALKRAMAAAGQTDMMEMWDKLFDFPSAQLLLTNDDIRKKESFDSFRDTIEALLAHGVLPIINENDTVTSDDRKVGDNDNLAAMVASSIDADALIMFTDVDGLYDKNPQHHTDARKLSVIENISDEIYAMAGGAISDQGTGGMRTKIEAAEKATSHGIDTYIVDGFDPKSFEQLINGENPGSHFLADKKPMSAGLHWMTHTVKECGEVILSEPESEEHEYQEAVTSNRIVAVKGEFAVGDTILLRDDDGNKIAKATANYSSCLLNYLADNDIRSKLDKDSSLLHNSIISNKHMAVLENS